MSDKQNDTKKEIHFPEKSEQDMPSEEFMETWMADAGDDEPWWFDAVCLVDDPHVIEHLTKKAEKRSLPNKLSIRKALMLLIVENPRYLPIPANVTADSGERDRLAHCFLTGEGFLR